MKPSKSTAGSKIGNGTSLFIEQIDGRTKQSRRFKELLLGIQATTGPMTIPQEILARRAATLSLWCEMREYDLVSDQPFDQSEYITVTNALRRLLADLGLAYDADPPELVKAKKIHKAVFNEVRSSL